MVESTFSYVGQTSRSIPNGTAAMDVVFVHGLGGDSIKTWSATDDPQDFWPAWLAHDFPNINVWSAGYDSGLLANVFTGAGGSLSDRATTLLDLALSNSVGTRPVVFIAHSLGGLIVKQMLRKCDDSATPKWKSLLSATKAVVLIGTPNHGSNLASTLLFLVRQFAQKNLTELAFGDDHLFELNEWFRNWAGSVTVKIAAYYETQKTHGVMVVTKLTANPTVLGCDPVAIDGDHTVICKPTTRQSQLYMSVSALVGSLLQQGRELTGAAILALPKPPVASMPLLEVGTQSLPAGLPLVSTQQFGYVDNSGIDAEFIEKIATAPALAPELLTDYQYFTTLAPDDRRPLAQKLDDGGRANEKNDAQRMKERFAMSLHRHSAQASALGRYVRLMSDIERRFKRHIQPSIDAGASIAQVNQLVQHSVIDPAVANQLLESIDVTVTLVESALYYLTGNCHVRWDASKD